MAKYTRIVVESTYAGKHTGHVPFERDEIERECLAVYDGEDAHIRKHPVPPAGPGVS
jgi:hypothetical protein